MKLVDLYESDIDQQEFNKFVEDIRTNCSDMVDAVVKSGRFLYRGISEGIDSFEVKTIHQHRTPIQMAPWRHEILIQVFTELGLKANRGNSIFCTTNRNIASDWGDSAIIFPVNGWSCTIFDKKKSGYAFDALRFGGMSDDEKYSNAMEAVLDLNPREVTSIDDFAKVLTDEYDDILITGTKYYACPWGNAFRLRTALMPKVS